MYLTLGSKAGIGVKGGLKSEPATHMKVPIWPVPTFVGMEARMFTSGLRR
jgi:hypothetical protein